MYAGNLTIWVSNALQVTIHVNDRQNRVFKFTTVSEGHTDTHPSAMTAAQTFFSHDGDPKPAPLDCWIRARI